ncbi:MAG: tRNA (adenosine(37)-N6)-threonylcarbamoyltransferase complex dimerization subunit type 1 TsaB [Bacilli bacterium]|nr:tRNA (adenosine(37)-N6)-threonylcarbamoyltransferase complex dimerization subunit type 1 TsaB [Bacilli bacterium]
MISLFIDTSTKNVSISIVKDDKILSLIQEEICNEHSKYATSYVKKVIDEANIDANDLDNILVVTGPGSFTGVRIGVTIAKTYGYLINKEIIAVSSLKSLALSVSDKDIVMSVIAANKSSYYVGVYDSKYNDIICEQCVSNTRLLELIDEYNPYIVSDNFNVLGRYKFNKVNLDILKIVDYYKDKDTINYHALVPNYLKLPQALENK